MNSLALFALRGYFPPTLNQLRGNGFMKHVWAILIALISPLGFADAIDEITDLNNNAYVKLYEQWVTLDHNQMERLEVIKKNTEIDLRRGEKLAETKVITQEELEDLQLKHQLADITLRRQEIKIKESEARLSIIKSKVAAGMTDIPICVRPMDVP